MPHQEEQNDFSQPVEKHSFQALLFDMDGTIIDSTAAIVKYWTLIGHELGVDPQVILATSHGRRSIDLFRIYDPSKANWDYICGMEGKIPKLYGADAVTIPGSRELLDVLQKVQAPWAVVTSGTRPLVEGWLDVMKLSKPEHLIVAEDVENGKPDPEGYLMGKKKLDVVGCQDGAVLVFEDAPAGVIAGKSAGCKVCALATTHSVQQLRDAGADWIVRDMRSVRLAGWDKTTGLATVEIRDGLRTSA